MYICIVVLFLCFCKAQDYVLTNQFSGPEFFDQFLFSVDNDPTEGYVNYVSQGQATSENLIQVQDSYVYIGADHLNIASGRGRNSVRISSTISWNEGLFIMDLLHMPSGCGTWPAWWMVGTSWPNNGEIDIIEGINNMTSDLTSLHTSEGCSMRSEAANSFTGTWEAANTGNSTDCYINAPTESSNQGCGIYSASTSFGVPFNENYGGVYAMEWTASYIRTFFFSRADIPADIAANSPNVSSWGQPYAFFALDEDCPASHFNNLSMVLDLTFCGEWAGAAFSAQCPGLSSCETYVKNNPQNFTEAYWAISYIQVYQDADSNSSYIVPTTEPVLLSEVSGAWSLPFVSFDICCITVVALMFIWV